jgi:hypothetical protein
MLTFVERALHDINLGLGGRSDGFGRASGAAA